MTAQLTEAEYTRAEHVQEDLSEYVIPLTQMRVHDALATNLPATASADDMALITGTPGTDAPTLQGVDFGGTSTDEKCGFQFQLPVEYVAGESISLRVRVGMLAASDGTATIDVECWPQDDDGAATSDVCSTAAQSMNSITVANKTFVITPTGLVPGDMLNFRLSFGGSDSGNLSPNITCEIQKVTVLLDIRG
jgi:hypothetical protein